MDSNLSCPYCRHVSKTLKAYVGHTQFHLSEYRPRFKCPFKGCRRQLLSYEGLASHVFRDHQGRPSPNIRNYELLRGQNFHEEIACSVTLCQEVCPSIQALIKHTKNHIKEGTSVNCPLSECPAKNKFYKISSFTSHISRHHRLTQGSVSKSGLANITLSASELDSISDDSRSLPTTSNETVPEPVFSNVNVPESLDFIDVCASTVDDSDIEIEAGNSGEKK